ncbi:transcription factor Spi-C [Oncorhynchus nerka]|uniref:transcription factor Spi-C n=1 Tax=Oncorhynchus nerka TaxID=8023 RepID=UPI0031B83498
MLRRHNKSLGVTQFLHAFHLTHNSVKNLGSGPVTAAIYVHPTTMNSFEDNQTDLEVILDFLEEHYRQGTGDGGEKGCSLLALVNRSIIVTVVTGRKVRLFHFLFEMLENLGMAHCISWVPAAADGVFRFSSRNKEQVAALWGQRKGNRRPMTYQKMSRALRNYARSGEIFKVKMKLTYQFSRATLSALRKCHQGKL